jgi:hypothetical protein
MRARELIFVSALGGSTEKASKTFRKHVGKFLNHEPVRKYYVGKFA